MVGVIFRWMTSIRKKTYTACFQILMEERGIRQINPFSFDSMIKYMRQIKSRFLNGRQTSESKAIRLVSKYSEKKEFYAQLIIFHPRKNGLISVNCCIIGWNMSIQKESYTTCIRMLRKERCIHPINHFSFTFDWEKFD